MNIYETLIEKAQPLSDLIIKNTREDFIKKGQPFTQRDEDYIRLLINWKYNASIHNYILPTDKLEDVQTNFSAGHITCEILIIRNGEKIKVRTEVIGAGGYNIQEYHHRYITNTFPKTGKVNGPTELVKTLKKRVNAFNRIETEEKYLENFIKRVETAKLNLLQLNEMSKDEIIDADESKKFIHETLETLSVGSYLREICQEDPNELIKWNEKILAQILNYHEQKIKNNKNEIEKLTKAAIPKQEKLIAKLKAI